MVTKGKLIPKLASLTVGLFVLSLWVHHLEHKRPEGIVLGQEFLPGLNVENISKIVLESDQGKEKLVFNRAMEDDSFVLENFDEYPVENSKLNDFLYKMGSITVASVIKSDEKVQKDLKVSEKDYENKISFYDSKGEKVVQFYVGKSGKPKGSYIRNADKNETYLSENALYQ